MVHIVTFLDFRGAIAPTDPSGSTPDQWRLWHSGSESSTSGWARVVDYAWHRGMWACLLCIFVPPPTSI